MNNEERQIKIDEILAKTLTEEEIKDYNSLGTSLGIIYGLMYSLEEEGILKAFGEDGIKKIKDSMEVITEYTQKGIELELTKEKVEEIRENLIKSELV